MKPIVLTVVDDLEDEFPRCIIEDTGTGLDIRDRHTSKVEASDQVAVDISHVHCDGCQMVAGVAALLGLTTDEADAIARWRTRKERGISSVRMGEILDKVARALNRPESLCETEYSRILLRVEYGNG